ncbi:hypothetical protein DEU56DRAFT_917483 [Suillus clintonianus]|uniref:uncharacterized protein n=1 Tax=Suillus clintonianus TaxID=1904413 RepID=UPI001B87EC1A|nr:uncharacterized protein DEU56DRAFT_917483 [Suillus clintonianus]KAG2123436.1 hypothetical protein DEU56DRAFT_917483 [Suillus clintonianus]
MLRVLYIQALHAETLAAKEHELSQAVKGYRSQLDDVTMQQISNFVPTGNEHQLPASMKFRVASHCSQPEDGKPNLNALDGEGLTHAVAPTLIVVEVSDICLTRLPKIGMVAFDDRFFVQLVVEDIVETQTTSSQAQQDGSIFWDQKHTSRNGTYRSPPTNTLHNVIAQAVARYPSHELGFITSSAHDSSIQTKTFTAFNQYVRNLARVMLEWGKPTGSVVVVYLTEHEDNMAAVWAFSREGVA